MANDNSRNPPQLEVGSVVKFNAKQRNIDYCYQGTVSSYKPDSSGFMIKNVTRGTEIIPAEELFYFRLWETTVIQAAEQNLGNPTKTQTDQNRNVGEASSSSTMLVGDGQRGSARNRDSTNTQMVTTLIETRHQRRLDLITKPWKMRLFFEYI